MSDLRTALKPFAELGGGCAISSTPAYHDLEDDVVVYKSGAGAITAGDVRKARAVLAAHADDGEPGPNSYVGWTIVGHGADGSLLVDGPTGARRRIWISSGDTK